MQTAATLKTSQELQLGLPGFTWTDLFRPAKLAELHTRFLGDLREAAPQVAARFDAYRACRGAGMTPQAISDVLVATAPHLADFVARLFGTEVEGGRRGLIERTQAQAAIFRMKDQLVKRRALKRDGAIDSHDPELDAAGRRLLRLGFGIGPDHQEDELSVARAACALLDLEVELRKQDARRDAAQSLRLKLADSGPDDDAAFVNRCLELLEKWLLMHRRDPAFSAWRAFRVPHPVSHDKLVELRRPGNLPDLAVGPTETQRHRDGFRLTDRRMSALEIADQVDYCLYCHGRDKDSCSKGLFEKDGAVKKNPLGVPLAGCPLAEKISEAQLLKKGGDSLAALAVIAVDNPLLPGTGHRICNDCMKACVFQKQEPVDIPQIETGILTDVLDLPWGLEIYGLLTRWNPLNVHRPFALPYHGRDVLVVGMGPAGYTLAHQLVNEGFGVVGIDGLKIEPLPEELVTQPIRRFRDLYVELDDRVLYGFGGVSEYGITVRWDKNFLMVLYLTLARRETFRLYGGVRFGGTLTLEDAWAQGFDHVAIAAGAGKPTLVDLENNLVRGIRKASDFLMGLQLTGAYKKSSLANLQVRLPAVVVGGGLTAIDAATELGAYYVVQCEKMLERYEKLCDELGAGAVRGRYDGEELGILDELIEHGRLLRDERRTAAAQDREPDFARLIAAWGGVTIAYRKRMLDSPAYRLNHEEIIKGFEEGIRFLENVAPKAAIPDELGALSALTLVRPDQNELTIPARTLSVAAGTSPNTIYEREHPGTFKLDRKGFFQSHRAVREGTVVRVEPQEGGFFTSYSDARGHTVSYYGDNHPRYAGSVVKAMASARDGYRQVASLFAEDVAWAEAHVAGEAGRDDKWRHLAAGLDDDLRPRVVAVYRLTPTIVELVVRAPRQAQRFQPGQFFRLQNFETRAAVVDGTKLVMEGIALTGAWVDREQGLLGLIALELGGSSRLIASLRPGEPVVVMGPTGAPTEIPRGESVLLLGGGLGNAVLFSIAKALRENGCRVIYVAGYRQPQDGFKRDEIEAATDQVVWASDVGPAILPRRPQDLSFVGNIVAAVAAYASGQLGAALVDLREVDRIIAIGSDRMMAAVHQARSGVLKPYLKPGHVAIGSINSPMQCMMKEVCAQCLQRHTTSDGKSKIVFSCFNQDQHLDDVDWRNLGSRLRQNTVQEKLTNLWLDRLIRRQPGIIRV